MAGPGAHTPGQPRCDSEALKRNTGDTPLAHENRAGAPGVQFDRRGGLQRQASCLRKVPFSELTQSETPSRSAWSSPIDVADHVLDAGLVLEPAE
jgi:hypothetical protein